MKASLFLVASALVPSVFALPQFCEDKEIRIERFCYIGRGGDAQNDEHEIEWFLQTTSPPYYPLNPSVDCGNGNGDDFCKVPANGCETLQNSRFKQIESFESMFVQVREDDGSGTPDFTSTFLPSFFWHSPSCQPYEVVLYVAWGSTSYDIVCIDGDIEVLGFNVAGIDACISVVIPDKGYAWHVIVQPRSGGRRHLAADDEEFISYLDECGSEEYEVSLHVGDNGHLHGLASPVEQEAVEAGCPSLATHASLSTEEDGNSYKELLAFHDHEEFKDEFQGENAVSIGQFSLTDLAEAYEKAEVSENSVYDLLSNNCASYLVNLSRHLGVPIDRWIKSFVANRLLQGKGRHIVDQIRESFMGFGHRYLIWGDATDEEVIGMLVEKTASD